MLQKRLSELSIGEIGRIVRINGEATLRRRVREMGLIASAAIMVDKIAPFGDPMGVVVQDYHLSLRKKEAADIWVEVEADHVDDGN